MPPVTAVELCRYLWTSPGFVPEIRSSVVLEASFLLVVVVCRRLTTTAAVSPQPNLTVTGELGPDALVLRVPIGDTVVRNSWWISSICPHAFMPHLSRVEKTKRPSEPDNKSRSCGLAVVLTFHISVRVFFATPYVASFFLVDFLCQVLFYEASSIRGLNACDQSYVPG